MKKLVLSLSAVLLITALIGCDFRQNEDSPQTNAGNISQLSVDKDINTQSGPLKITSVGDNKLVITLTDKRVPDFLKDIGTDALQQAFRAYFFAQNQQKLSLSMNTYNWSFEGAEDMSQGGVSDFSVIMQTDTYQSSGNTIVIEVNQAGITKRLSQCDNYRLYYFDKDSRQEMLAEGGVPDIVSAKASGETIKISYIDDDRAIVRLAGETFENNLNDKQYHELTLAFYLPGNDSYTPLYELRLTSGSDMLSSSLYQLTLQQNEGLMDSKELIGDKHNQTTQTAQGYSVLLFYDEIEDLLSACDRIVVTDGEGKTFLTESYESAVTDASPPVSPIPNVFEINAKDADFFYPITDDYVVMMLDMPMATVLDYGYGWTDGVEYYAPMGAHEEPLKIMSVQSYNEFGMMDQRTKIIYPSVTAAMTAPAGRLDWYPAAKLTKNTATDAPILADFFAQLDKNIFGKPTRNDADYQYFGHYDKVRYFSGDMQQIKILYNSPPPLSYDRDSQFNGDGFLTETIPYSYDFPNFAINLSQMRDSTATITVYSSQAAA